MTWGDLQVGAVARAGAHAIRWKRVSADLVSCGRGDMRVEVVALDEGAYVREGDTGLLEASRECVPEAS